MGKDQNHWGTQIPIGSPCDFMIKCHKLQNYVLILFFIIIRVISAHYQSAKFHIDSFIKN